MKSFKQNILNIIIYFIILIVLLLLGYAGFTSIYNRCTNNYPKENTEKINNKTSDFTIERSGKYIILTKHFNKKYTITEITDTETNEQTVLFSDYFSSKYVTISIKKFNQTPEE